VLYLITSILLSTGIFVLFQRFQHWGVHTFQAIVINYGVAALLGWNLAGGWNQFKTVWPAQWVIIALLMGGLFIYLFQLIAKSTQSIGVTVTSIAAKLSMVIPVALFLLFDPSDSLTWQKGMAISLSIPAIILTSWKPEQRGKQRKWLIPLIIFIGSGMIDLMFAGFSGSNFMTSVNDRYLFASLPLITAFICGMVWWLIKSGKSSMNWFPNASTIASGLTLGVINFGSLYFLLETYDKVSIDRSAVMPINNLGIILASSACSLAILKESLFRRNYIGLILGMLSILLLLWSEIIE